MKPQLRCSPFSYELEYGCGHEGYWSYDHMVLQIEDCVDILSHTHPQFDILFLLDHSNGHDKMRPNGLNLNKLNIRHGGKQPRMRDTVLTESEFGPFPSKLQSGQTQSMVFASHGDTGPCYLTESEIKMQMLDVNTGKKRKVNLTKAQLIAELKSHGILHPKGSRKVLQEQCTQIGVPLYKRIDIIQEGWVGKSKGSLQILFERGWINPDHMNLYTANGMNGDVDGVPADPTGCKYSINALMRQQGDFLNEVTLLQYHAEEMGVSIDRTPKCHPEMAGEGIEYIWALAKLKYRRATILKKRSKEKFRKLVTECTDPDTNLNIQRVRSCSKRARSYMKLYRVVKDVSFGENGVVNKHNVLESTMKLYLKLKKKAKSHRSVIDNKQSDLDLITNDYNSVIDSVVSKVNKNNIKTEGHNELIGVLLKKMNCD